MNDENGGEPSVNQATKTVALLNGQASERQQPRSLAPPTYARVVQSVKQLVPLATPRYSISLVVSKGDEQLLDLGERYAWHFPRAINGKFAGCYPADSAEAVHHLESLRAQGGQFLIIPSTSFWWLEYYTDFTRHLQERYRIVLYYEEACIIYDLA
jgi:hypothetical protein